MPLLGEVGTTMKEPGLDGKNLPNPISQFSPQAKLPMRKETGEVSVKAVIAAAKKRE